MFVYLSYAYAFFEIYANMQHSQFTVCVRLEVKIRLDLWSRKNEKKTDLKTTLLLETYITTIIKIATAIALRIMITMNNNREKLITLENIGLSLTFWNRFDIELFYATFIMYYVSSIKRKLFNSFWKSHFCYILMFLILFALIFLSFCF